MEKLYAITIHTHSKSVSNVWTTDYAYYLFIDCTGKRGKVFANATSFKISGA